MNNPTRRAVRAARDMLKGRAVSFAGWGPEEVSAALELAVQEYERQVVQARRQADQVEAEFRRGFELRDRVRATMVELETRLTVLKEMLAGLQPDREVTERGGSRNAVDQDQG